MELTPEQRDRLLNDTVFWARHCAKIVDKRRQLVPLEANRPQKRFDAALEAQRAAGKPMRAIVLKARQLGFSTWGTAKIMQRVTQRPYRRALVVAQENDTSAALFDIADRIWKNLPDELELKPRRTHFARGKYMRFGETSRILQNEGVVGLDSSLEVDTAREVEGGRGFTFTDVELTEVAFWPDPSKMTAILNAVPDQPGTLVILESTANGLNHFHERWQAAEAGESDYVPIFAGWTEDPAYARPFESDETRAEFVESIGTGPWGEDEPMLVELYGCAPEQLHWRRKKIVDDCESKLEVFKQEYPVSPDEAFRTSGKQVFSMVLVGRMRAQVELADPKDPAPDRPGPMIGSLAATQTVTRRIRSGVVEVPRGAVWVPKRQGDRLADPWRVWELPDPGDPGQMRPPGAYIVSADPAGGEENEKGDLAWHAIQVIDHRSRNQVAEWRSRIDPDQIAEQLVLAAFLYNKALIVPEVTGGYGGFIARRIRRDYGYPLVYRRRPLTKDRDRQEEPLGWSTTVGTKPFLEGHAQQLLRDGYGDEADGDCGYVRSRLLAGDRLGLTPGEFATYVSDDRGKTGPLGNAFSDLLMAWMIAQFVAHERPVPTKERSSSTSTARRRVRDPVTGW